MSERRVEISELEQRIRADSSGADTKTLVETLLAGKQRVVRIMDRGVGKAEFARLTALAAAYDASVEALPKLWATIHEPNS